jgi:hypothetical protein
MHDTHTHKTWLLLGQLMDWSVSTGAAGTAEELQFDDQGGRYIDNRGGEEVPWSLIVVYSNCCLFQFDGQGGRYIDNSSVLDESSSCISSVTSFFLWPSLPLGITKSNNWIAVKSKPPPG